MAALSGSAGAAEPGDRARVEDNKFALAALDEGFGCLLKRNPGRVRAFLAAVPGSDREMTIRWYLYHQLAFCLSHASGFRIDDAVGRGLAAERTFATNFSEAPVPAAPIGETEFGPLSEPARLPPRIMPSYVFARCVVMADAAGVRALLASARDSAAETAAFAALRPDFAPCVARGATLATDRWTLRPFLAEALYQLYASRAAGRRS